MEPMVVCALGIVAYFGYLTVRDILTDLQTEGILVKVQARKKRETFPTGILVSGGRSRCIGGLISAYRGLVEGSNLAGNVSGNAWAGDLSGVCYGYHHKSRRFRG